jgi:hypothetical protein
MSWRCRSQPVGNDSENPLDRNSWWEGGVTGREMQAVAKEPPEVGEHLE